jgi:hypothetical protein
MARNRSRFVNLVVIVFVLADLRIAGQERPKLQPSPESVKPGWERWRSEVPISGGVRVGVMNASDQRLNVNTLTVFLPPFSESTLCLELSSQDGRYSARLAYPLARAEPGRVLLGLPTRYARELIAYQPSQVAILATLSMDCSLAPDAYLVAGWGQGTLTRSVTVLLNSRIPTRLRSADGALSFDCRPVDGVTTAYNLSCDIPRDQINAVSPLVIEMRRGTTVTRLTLPIRLP